MPETCVKFGEHRARVMIEEKEVPHLAIDVDSEKKEVSCWVASEEGKVRESFRYRYLVHSNKSRRFQLNG